jgi:predicted nucleic acid-binding protein
MSQQLDFFDTNMLVAATLPFHVHHAAANKRLAQLQRNGGACSTHTLAEAYTNLTRVSKGYGIAPSDALHVLRYVQDTFTLVTLTPREYVHAIDSVAKQNLRGAIVYDALLIACARKIKARYIYTYNIKHFREVAQDLASIIVEP